MASVPENRAIDMTPGQLKRPMEKTNSDAAQLNELLSLMNNPDITGAVVPPEEKAAAKAVLQGIPAPIPANEPLSPTPPADPEPVAAQAAIAAPSLVLLTGRSGVGKSFLAAQAGYKVLELDMPIWTFVKGVFPSAKPEELQLLVNTIRAWGDGWITKDLPINPARLLFVERVRPMWPKFGHSGFWADHLLEYLEGEMASEGMLPQAAVTNVTTTADFQALTSRGFKHFHVMCSVQTLGARTKRQGADDRLAAALDQDVTKKISQQRQGQRLRCVWSDSQPSPNPQRLYSVDSWLQEMNQKPVVLEGITVGE